MTRAIKFRAWDGKKMWQYAVPLLSKAHNGGTINVSDNEEGSFNQFINGELMQFTGLYDSTKWEELTEYERKKWVLAGNMPSEWNGKPIYEHDIVSGVSYKEPFAQKTKIKVIGIVKYSLQDAGFYVNWKLPSGYRTYPHIKQCKVIGDIYQNPELLEVQS